MSDEWREYSAHGWSVHGIAVRLQVSQDMEAMAFNTAISAMMVFTNHLMTLEKPPREAVEVCPTIGVARGFL